MKLTLGSPATSPISHAHQPHVAPGDPTERLREDSPVVPGSSRGQYCRGHPTSARAPQASPRPRASPGHGSPLSPQSLSPRKAGRGAECGLLPVGRVPVSAHRHPAPRGLPGHPNKKPVSPQISGQKGQDLLATLSHYICPIGGGGVLNPEEAVKGVVWGTGRKKGPFLVSPLLPSNQITWVSATILDQLPRRSRPKYARSSCHVRSPAQSIPGHDPHTPRRSQELA